MNRNIITINILINIMDKGEEEYHILMSPLLSEKFTNLDNKINNIENYLKKNREMYVSMLETIEKASKENHKILKENREMYTKALYKIQETEQQNMDKIKPLLQNIEKNNTRLEENILNGPHYHSRVYNHFWRKNAITRKTTKPSSLLAGIIGLPYLELEYNDIFKKN